MHAFPLIPPYIILWFWVIASGIMILTSWGKHNKLVGDNILKHAMESHMFANQGFISCGKLQWKASCRFANQGFISCGKLQWKASCLCWQRTMYLASSSHNLKLVLVFHNIVSPFTMLPCHITRQYEIDFFSEQLHMR
jgi:hypothetical protein